MPRLVLKFENAALKEVPLGTRPVTIGRAPDNDIQIDNLTVSEHHARISSEDTRVRIDDLDSLNGVSVNGTPVKTAWLSSGDYISIGKHLIFIDLERDVALFEKSRHKAITPKLEETYVMAGYPRSDPGQHPASKETSSEPASDRARVPNVIVLKGKTAQKKYMLLSKLTVIGKSSLATIQLRGWFAPQAALPKAASGPDRETRKIVPLRFAIAPFPVARRAPHGWKIPSGGHRYSDKSVQTPRWRKENKGRKS